jgi:tight adherence protein C
LVCAVASTGFTLLASAVVDLPDWCVVAAFVLGMLLPWFRLRAVARDRVERVTRSLPGIIELAAMCMGAGLDFPSSLRRVVDSAAEPNDPIVEELHRVLQELDLGCTRRSAMLGFATRVPSNEVRELVSSVLQAEDKGNPLARVLTIQARTLRLRRSVAAEEVASEAALMLVGPMTLIFICVIVLLLGPVAVRVMTGGFEAV